MLTAGCVTTQTSGCGGLSPIRLTKDEVRKLTDESLRQYVTQLKVGERNCGWKAR